MTRTLLAFRVLLPPQRALGRIFGLAWRSVAGCRDPAAVAAY